jgi:hypothetical protein
LVLARKTPAPDPRLAAVFARRLTELIAEWRAAGIPPAAMARDLRAALDGLRR